MKSWSSMLKGNRLRFPKRVMAKYFLSVLLGMVVSAQAGDLPYQLSGNGTDPTEIRTRVDLYFAQVTSLSARELFGSVLSGNYTLSQDLALGIDLPFIYTELSGGRIGSGLGDIGIWGTYNFHRRSREKFLKAVSGSIRIIMDTGSADEGTGKGSAAVAPSLTASFSAMDEVLIAPSVEWFATYDHPADYTGINELRFSMNGVINFEEGIWISVRPELMIDLTGDEKAAYPIRNIIGYMIDENFGISAQYTYYIAGPEQLNYFANIDLRYLFN